MRLVLQVKPAFPIKTDPEKAAAQGKEGQRRPMVRFFCLTVFSCIFAADLFPGDRIVFHSDCRVRIQSNASPGWCLRGKVVASLGGKLWLRADSVWLPDRRDSALLSGKLRVIAPGYTLTASSARLSRTGQTLTLKSATLYNGSTLSGTVLSNITLTGRRWILNTGRGRTRLVRRGRASGGGQ